VHVFTGGYAETGTDEGRQVEADLVTVARSQGARVIGPNCMGIHRPAARWTFRHDLPVMDGSLGIVAQSGGITIAAIRLAAAHGIGVSAAISFGNAADVSAAEAIGWLVADERTERLAVYLESAGDKHLPDALANAAARKPVSAWISGRGPHSARAALFHTGARGGPPAADLVATADFRVVRDLPSLLGLPSSNRDGGHVHDPPSTCVLSISGGVSVIVTEALEQAGVRLADVSSRTSAVIAQAGGDLLGNASNPIDLGGSYLSRGRLRAVIAALGADPNVEVLVLHIAVDYLEEAAGRHPGFVEAWFEAVIDAVCEADLSCVALVWPVGISSNEGWVTDRLDAARIPAETDVIALPERLAEAFACSPGHPPRH
jgi:acetyltransferase